MRSVVPGSRRSESSSPCASDPTAESQEDTMSHFRHPTRAALAAAVAALALPSSALATFPGRDGRIAFHSATATEGTQIFTVRPNGRDLRQITHVDGDAISADWSPDGRRLAFEI